MFSGPTPVTWGVSLFLLFALAAGVAIAMVLARKRSQPLLSRWMVGLLIGMVVIVAIPILVLTIPGLAQTASARPAPVSPTAALYLFQIEPNADQQLMSLRAQDGSRRWIRPPTSDSGVDFTTVSGDTIYMVDPIPSPQGSLLHAFRTSDGSEQWQVRVGSGDPATVMDVTPVVADGLIYLVEKNTSGLHRGSVYAVRASDGVLAWSHQLENFPADFDAPLVAGGGLLFVGSTNGSVRALRSRDGSVAWQTPARSDRAALPVLGSDLIYVTHPDDSEIIALHASDGAPAWTAPEVELGRLMFSGQHLYLAGSNNVYAFDPMTGALLWRHLIQETIGMRLVEQDGIAYVAGGPSLTAYRATSGVQLWRIETGSPRLAYATPVAIGGAVFVPTVTLGEVCFLRFFFCAKPASVSALSATNGATFWSQDMAVAADLWATT